MWDSCVWPGAGVSQKYRLLAPPLLRSATLFLRHFRFFMWLLDYAAAILQIFCIKICYRLVPVLVRSMKYSELDIILLRGDVEEVSQVWGAFNNLRIRFPSDKDVITPASATWKASICAIPDIGTYMFFASFFVSWFVFSFCSFSLWTFLFLICGSCLIEVTV